MFYCTKKSTWISLGLLANKAKLVHNFSSYVYFFSLRVSGDCVPIITRNTLHTRQSSTQKNKYQVSHKYSYFSWWWAHSPPKHVQKRNEHTKKICAPSWLYLQDCTEMHVQQNIKFPRAIRPQDTLRFPLVRKHYEQRATTPTADTHWDVVTLGRCKMATLGIKKLLEW